METLLNVRVPPRTYVRLRAMSTVVGLLQRDVIMAAMTRYQDRLPESARRRVKRALEPRRRTVQARG